MKTPKQSKRPKGSTQSPLITTTITALTALLITSSSPITEDLKLNQIKDRVIINKGITQYTYLYQLPPKVGTVNHLIVQFADYEISKGYTSLPHLKITTQGAGASTFDYFDSQASGWLFNQNFFFVPLGRFKSFNISLEFNPLSFLTKVRFRLVVLDQLPGVVPVNMDMVVVLPEEKKTTEFEFFVNKSRDLGAEKFLELADCGDDVRSIEVFDGSGDGGEGGRGPKRVGFAEKKGNQDSFFVKFEGAKSGKIRINRRFSGNRSLNRGFVRLRIWSIPKIDAEKIFEKIQLDLHSFINAQYVPAKELNHTKNITKRRRGGLGVIKYKNEKFEKKAIKEYGTLEIFGDAEQAKFKKQCGFDLQLFNMLYSQINGPEAHKLRPLSTADWLNYEALGSSWVNFNIQRTPGWHQIDLNTLLVDDRWNNQLRKRGALGAIPKSLDNKVWAFIKVNKVLKGFKDDFGVYSLNSTLIEIKLEKKEKKPTNVFLFAGFALAGLLVCYLLNKVLGGAKKAGRKGDGGSVMREFGVVADDDSVNKGRIGEL